MARRGATSLTAERRRAREAERRAQNAAARARQTAAGVSPDRDLEGDAARCVADADNAAHKCREQVRRVDEAAHEARYSDRDEHRDAVQDAQRAASRAESYADEAELAADGVEWTTKRIAAGDREMAASGADWATTLRGWRRRA